MVGRYTAALAMSAAGHVTVNRTGRLLLLWQCGARVARPKRKSSHFIHIKLSHQGNPSAGFGVSGLEPSL